ncbi:MAG: FtsX-like permease family protein, partial [Bacteroidota bacterium]
ESLKATWVEEFPGMDFVYYPQEEVFQNFTFMIELSQTFSRYLGLFALFISCMGLFGMASQRVGQRMKEVGIRKAMGASALHIIFLVNRGFLMMLGLATLIATSVAYIGLRAILQSAPSEIPMSVTPFVLASLLVFLVAAASLTSQTRKLLKVRPAEVLRYA